MAYYTHDEQIPFDRPKYVEAKDTIESILDAGWTVADVLGMLTTVCYEKSDHVRVNWQDVPLAKQWERAAKACDSVRDRAENTGV